MDPPPFITVKFDEKYKPHVPLAVEKVVFCYNQPIQLANGDLVHVEKIVIRNPFKDNTFDEPGEDDGYRMVEVLHDGRCAHSGCPMDIYGDEHFAAYVSARIQFPVDFTEADMQFCGGATMESKYVYGDEVKLPNPAYYHEIE